METGDEAIEIHKRADHSLPRRCLTANARIYLTANGLRSKRREGGV
jgi:hypothetical protein